MTRVDIRGKHVRMFTCLAPCKINLSLRIVGKRLDGYHELQTLMAPLALADTLTFEKNENGGLAFYCDHEEIPHDESNLAVKAVRIMERELGRPLAWTLTLEKRIPFGAGLGGGSSDAASVLLALNELEHAGLSQSRLLELAAELGSDVGFFIMRSVCNCSGRGEIVQLADGPAQRFVSPVLLLKPRFGVSTPEAYQHWAQSRRLPGISYEPVTWNRIEFVNDLERPVFEKFIFLAEVKMWLMQQPGVHVAMMSGSGSTMFALIDTIDRGQEIAQQALQELDPTLWTWCGMGGCL